MKNVAHLIADHQKEYPSKTPKTGSEMSASEKRKRIAQKKRLGQPAGKPRRVQAVRRRKKKMSLEQKICDEIKAWSKYALEIPNENYNNLPSCPYAKAAWKNNKVGFALKTTKIMTLFIFDKQISRL